MNNQVLIRDVDRLELSPKAKKAAKELVDLIDMPVVFDLDARGNKSVAGRMPGKHNQFWVTVVRGLDQNETERIILAHLFRGVTETLRFPSLDFDNEFRNKLIKRNKKSEINSHKDLISFIVSFASTIICECFLRPYEITTGLKTRHRNQREILNMLSLYSYRKGNLSKFKQKDKKYIQLVLHSANHARLLPDFENEIIEKIKKVFPYSVSQRMLADIDFFKKHLQKLIAEFTKENSASCMRELYEKIIERFRLKSMVKIVYPFAIKINDKDELEKAEIKEAFSFVPENIGDSEFYIKCIRYANSAIVLLQEYFHYVLNKELPDVQVYLGTGKIANAYANHIENDIGSITFTDSLFTKLKEFADDCQIDGETKNGYCFADDYRERRLKIMIFLIVLHEYAHILNGDCKTSFHQSAVLEDKADSFVKENINTIILYQYRTGESPFDPQTAKSYLFSEMEMHLVPECWRMITGLRNNEK